MSRAILVGVDAPLPQRALNRLQRGLLLTLLVAAGLDLLGLFLTDL